MSRISQTPVAGFLAEGGWHVVDAKKGELGGGGLTSYRHGGSWIEPDAATLQTIERRLGFTGGEVRAVYRSGPLSPGQLELRARVDARLLEIADAGGSVVTLGRALGWPSRCQWIERALERARAA